MDRLAEALIKLVETGAPLAANVAGWYFVSQILGNVIFGATVLGLALIITRTVRYVEDERTK